jgi:hypothetical protein
MLSIHPFCIQPRLIGSFFVRSTINIKCMSDNKTKQGKQDDIRVDINDSSEVEYLHRQFPGKSHDEIKKAIREKGPLRKNIEEYLSRS